MNYTFVITKDVIEDGKFNDTLRGNCNKPFCEIDKPKLIEELKKKGEYFVLRDDDKETYFHGYICGDDYDGFEPLDNFGAGWGCTEILYRNKTTGKMDIL